MDTFYDWDTGGYFDALADHFRRVHNLSLGIIPFHYDFPLFSIPHSTTQTQTVTLDDDSDFVLCELTHWQTDTEGNQHAYFNHLCRLWLEAPYRLLTNIPTHQTNLLGLGTGYPKPLAVPYYIHGGRPVTLEINNLNTELTKTMRATLVGCKVVSLGRAVG